LIKTVPSLLIVVPLVIWAAILRVTIDSGWQAEKSTTYGKEVPEVVAGKLKEVYTTGAHLIVFANTDNGFNGA